MRKDFRVTKKIIIHMMRCLVSEDIVCDHPLPAAILGVLDNAWSVREHYHGHAILLLE